MVTIFIFLNNGVELQIQCPASMPAADIHMLAKQISEARLVHSTRIRIIKYVAGREVIDD